MIADLIADAGCGFSIFSRRSGHCSALFARSSGPCRRKKTREICLPCVWSLLSRRCGFHCKRFLARNLLDQTRRIFKKADPEALTRRPKKGLYWWLLPWTRTGLRIKSFSMRIRGIPAVHWILSRLYWSFTEIWESEATLKENRQIASSSKLHCRRSFAFMRRVWLKVELNLWMQSEHNPVDSNR